MSAIVGSCSKLEVLDLAYICRWRSAWGHPVVAPRAGINVALDGRARMLPDVLP
jgi:hypothetical protein